MNNHNQPPQRGSQNQEVPQGIVAAKLAVLGGSITTIGDAISTLAAVIALEDLNNSSNDKSNDQNNSDIQNMQKQINDLTRTVQAMQKKDGGH